MPDMHVKLQRNYFLENGGKVMRGSEIELPEKEAKRIINLGVAVAHTPVSHADWLLSLGSKVKQKAELSEETKAHYQSDFRCFERWCSEHGIDALPVTEDALLRYVVHRLADGIEYNTVKRNVFGITRIQGLTEMQPSAGHLNHEVFVALSNFVRSLSDALYENIGSAVRGGEAWQFAKGVIDKQWSEKANASKSAA
ncbi:hypothetical protein NWI01_11550 [Nitrobacter winogradskyi]|nr:hypothetical protein NWI01_11550 [Nitrobacter winogradskyi]